MKYGMERLINLGKYGIQFENIKLVVMDCDSREEAESEIKAWRSDIEDKFKKLTNPVINH